MGSPQALDLSISQGPIGGMWEDCQEAVPNKEADKNVQWLCFFISRK